MLDDQKHLQVKFNGQGILGAAVTSGEAYNVPDAHVHYAYDATIDELLLQMREEETSQLAVPLTDHVGRVIGVLHAASKHRARLDQSEAQNKAPDMQLRPSELVTPTFTSEDLSS